MKNQTQEHYILNAKGLKVSFKKGKKIIDIVRGIDLKIKPSQIVGLVGESGSGKSVSTKSLLNINVGGITTADKLELSGIDLTTLKDFYSIRGKKIGYIPQDPMTALNPTRKIWKQIDDVLLLHRPEFKTKQERKKYMISILESFGIRDVQNKINSYPHSFSGGMKQRVVIAMIVAAQPDLIIADEPTTALDATVQASVLELLEKIRTKYKVSIIFISHNIAVVAKFCDFIYVMYAGAIVEKGLKKEIFTNPKHPYTWALISAIPNEDSSNDLYTIPGNPPNLEHLPYGDPFAPRNEFALKVDFKREPPLFKVSSTHSAATWLLHPDSPVVKMPKDVIEKIKKFKEVFNE
ncbi:MAG: ABC transporter ATP-binding protein [Mycoplasma sp.]|nr:ABC transporter ATP-binding protein [Mycoplasma sp.]